MGIHIRSLWRPELRKANQLSGNTLEGILKKGCGAACGANVITVLSLIHASMPCECSESARNKILRAFGLLPGIKLLKHPPWGSNPRPQG